MSETPGAALPWRRTAAQLETDLAAWARSFRGEGAEVTDVQVPDNGMSNDSVRFRLDGEALVGRLAPAPDSHYPTFPTYDLDLQRRVLELVRTRTDVPVPEVVHVELSDEWLGVPFLLMRAVEGVVPTDSPNYLMDPGGWFLQGTPEDWKRMERSTIDVLVRLHRIADDGEATAFLRSDAPGDTALARQLADHRSYYEWARDGHTVPILERAFDALTATLPANDRSVLNWGDARPGNIIYRDFEPAAVLDWEMARVGPPEIDVSWATFFHRFFASMGELGGLSVPAMFDRAETVATYEQLSGDRLEDLAWYEALAGFHFGIILARMSLRSVAFGLQPQVPDDPNDLILFAPLLEQLLEEI
jgi:aminoglycoside phosphotransferase (APT) family kinase protein